MQPTLGIHIFMAMISFLKAYFGKLVLWAGFYEYGKKEYLNISLLFFSSRKPHETSLINRIIKLGRTYLKTLLCLAFFRG